MKKSSKSSKKAPNLLRKNLSLKAKIIALLVAIALIIAAAIWGFWYANRNSTNTVNDNSGSQHEGEDLGDANTEPPADAGPSTTEKQLEKLKEEISKAGELGQEEQVQLYINAAILSAELGDEQASEYAAKALEIVNTGFELADPETIRSLELISSGNFEGGLQALPAQPPEPEVPDGEETFVEE